nr:rhamnulokinase [Lysinibacillus timonensis]
MNHIAIDIGASSGRIILGVIRNGEMKLNEIHRFPNNFKQKEKYACWDIQYLQKEILIGLQIAKQHGIESCTVSIDTWAVDYALIDKQGNLLQDIISYRDHRTDKTMEKVFKMISKETIYNKTGLQFLSFNTLFQLFVEDKNLLDKVDKILLVPDYLNFFLTNVITAEITNASTTQLLNIQSRDYDSELLSLIGLRRDQFPTLIEPGAVIGKLLNEKFPDYDLPSCTVIAVGSHDTASAVLGVPALTENWAYLSSGTWSLLGVELNKPIVSKESLEENYTNEYGVFRTYRFLKNIMGLWGIQEVKRLLPNNIDFNELVNQAQTVLPFKQFINLNDNRFLNPENMIEEIKSYCRETNQSIPDSVPEITAAIYHNLALITAIHIDHIERIIERPIETIHIVGGGSKNDFLNQCIATYSQRTVLAGPSEATAIGNLLIQLMNVGTISSIQEGRKLVQQSFTLNTFEPKPYDKQALFGQFLNTTKLIRSDVS